MKLKGTTKIELTNVKTGEKETYTHENFVTEFAEEYFRECGALNTNPIGSLQDLRPIDDLFGGIMFFNKKINQNTDDTGNHPHPLYCPAGTKMIANGAIDFTGNSNATELGQYDDTESGTPNETQRVYVYNWDTDEGNGKINSVCLTSKAGGYIGAGNATSGVRDNTQSSNPRRIFQYSGTGDSSRTFETAQLPRMAGLDLSQSQVAMLSDTAKNALIAGSATVNWYDVPVAKLQPFISKIAFNENVLTVRRTQTKTFTARTSCAAARVMGGTGYILLVGSTANYIQNGATVYAVQLNKDGTVTEKTYSVTATSSTMPNNVPLNDTYFIGGKIIGNDLYIAYGSTSGSNMTYVYRIKADGSVVNLNTDNTMMERTFLVNEGRVYIGTRAYYDTQEEETYVTNAGEWHQYHAVIYRFGLWNCYDAPLAFVTQGNTTDFFKISPLVCTRPPCNWLSTINNLPNEIEKTADKTMKVTYTLTLSQGGGS